MKFTAQFQQWLDQQPPPWKIGQALIQPGYFLVHQQDAAAKQLREVTDLKAWRELLKFDDDGNFRPLKAAPNLQRGLKYGPLDFPGLVLALEYLYPAVIPNWALFHDGKLEITDYAETSERQTGRFAITKTLSASAQLELVDEVCEAHCLKQRLWNVSQPAGNSGTTGNASSEIVLLCPEACNYFISKARDKTKGAAEQELPE